MRVLVIGSGGREHTLVWKIAQSPLVERIFCAPGNGGIQELAECLNISPSDIAALAGFAEKEKIDLTVVGPEPPLAEGITDEFIRRGLRIFGPTRAAAQIEASKVFAKGAMVKYGIPTADFIVFDDAQRALRHIRRRPTPMVVKADGLAAGKGVIVCRARDDADEAVRRIMVEKEFGASGDKVIIEDCLVGEEASLLAFTDGETVLPMDSAQDHKPVFDNDEGPNTGGMGAYSPAPVVTPEVYRRINNEILTPMIRGLAAEGIEYKGVLYAGLMIDDDGPKILEFNARFGDPETQALLPRLENDLVEVMDAVIDGRLSEIELKWSTKAAVCVVMASGGYPGPYEKGKTISGLDSVDDNSVVVFHAGTKRLDDGRIVTDGGRVLGVTGLSDTIGQAIERTYAAAEKIHFDGAHYRKDIGAKALRPEKWNR
ncbi:MAG: phosphoribosylamine--glycine ligase [bacterium]|nr:phosphoribosylamine--glycine ligase [bacterium]